MFGRGSGLSERSRRLGEHVVAQSVGPDWGESDEGPRPREDGNLVRRRFHMKSNKKGARRHGIDLRRQVMPKRLRETRLPSRTNTVNRIGVAQRMTRTEPGAKIR